MSGQDELERLARIAVNCGCRIHKELGPGLLESAYEALMELRCDKKVSPFAGKFPSP